MMTTRRFSLKSWGGVAGRNLIPKSASPRAAGALELVTSVFQFIGNMNPACVFNKFPSCVNWDPCCLPHIFALCSPHGCLCHAAGCILSRCWDPFRSPSYRVGRHMPPSTTTIGILIHHFLCALRHLAAHFRALSQQ